MSDEGPDLPVHLTQMSNPALVESAVLAQKCVGQLWAVVTLKERLRARLEAEARLAAMRPRSRTLRLFCTTPRHLACTYQAE